MPEENVHQGHRERVRQRFLRDGLDHFEPHQVLEMLLFYAIPRKDTNVLAHALLSRFGSFSGVFEAELEDLKAVKGMSENAAALIKLMPEMARYYLCNQEKGTLSLKNAEQIADFLEPQFLGRKKEMVYLICLNGKGEILYSDFIFEGTINSVSVCTREIVDKALRQKATSVILAHNHPEGLAIPSHEDLMTTRQLVQALDLVNIRLYDHFIIHEFDAVSMRDSGFFSEWRDN